VLGVVCMYVQFGFEWCVGGCESVGTILVIGDISMVRVSHCVVLVLRIFMVVACLCDVRKRLSSMRVCVCI
jgi:hypothetical protein